MKGRKLKSFQDAGGRTRAASLGGGAEIAASQRDPRLPPSLGAAETHGRRHSAETFQNGQIVWAPGHPGAPKAPR